MVLKDNLEWRESNGEKCMVDIKLIRYLLVGIICLTLIFIYKEDITFHIIRILAQNHKDRKWTSNGVYTNPYEYTSVDTMS